MKHLVHRMSSNQSLTSKQDLQSTEVESSTKQESFYFKLQEVGIRIFLLLRFRRDRQESFYLSGGWNPVVFIVWNRELTRQISHQLLLTLKAEVIPPGYFLQQEHV